MERQSYQKTKDRMVIGNPHTSIITLSVNGLNSPIKIRRVALAGVGQLIGALFHRMKGHWFDSWSGCIPMLPVRSLLGARMRRQQIDVFLSHQCFSLSLSFSSSSLYLPLSLKAIEKCPQMRILKNVESTRLDQKTKPNHMLPSGDIPQL